MFLVAYRGQPVPAFALEEGIMQKRVRQPPGVAARGGSCGEGEHPCRGHDGSGTIMEAQTSDKRPNTIGRGV